VESEARPVVLASASPRRRELLERAGIRFEVQPSRVVERARPGEPPDAQAARLAREKACDVARAWAAAPRWVLGADTLVALDGEALGKPRDDAHALELLRRLAGRTHAVITAVALAHSTRDTLLECRVRSEVCMRPLDEAALRRYVACGESLDKAGAYAAQGAGRRLITHLRGSESNVIGLPLDETRALLRRADPALA